MRGGDPHPRIGDSPQPPSAETQWKPCVPVWTDCVSVDRLVSKDELVSVWAWVSVWTGCERTCVSVDWLFYTWHGYRPWPRLRYKGRILES